MRKRLPLPRFRHIKIIGKRPVHIHTAVGVLDVIQIETSLGYSFEAEAPVERHERIDEEFFAGGSFGEVVVAEFALSG